MPKIISVLYEDTRYLVIDKPAGIPVIPTPKKEKHTVTTIINDQIGVQDTGKLHPCHRLDVQTSGCLIYAKGKKNQQLMMQLFKDKKVGKRYIAFINGQLDPPNGTFKEKISHLEAKRFHSRKGESPAVTKYKTLEIRSQFSILEVEPVTGKTNQIRIHMANNGHPLLGERKYAIAKRYPVKFRRVALHSKEISWPDPDSKKKITIKSNLPKDMEVFCDRN